MSLPVFLRLPQVAEALGVSPDTILAWAREGKFPPGRKLGPGVRAWTESEISDWIESRPSARKTRAGADAPDALVA